MEISVGFADKEEEYYTGQGYVCDKSVLGRVYYPAEGVETAGQIKVCYMEYPWISTFETEGIHAVTAEHKPDEVRMIDDSLDGRKINEAGL